MPYCPACRAEYVEGVPLCADCRVALVAVLPPDAPRARRVVEVPLARFPSEWQAAMWAERLAGEGIRSVLVPLGVGAAWGASALMPHELRVAAEDYPRAGALLVEMGFTG